VRVLLPLQFVALLGWWFWQSVGWDPERWYHPLKPFSLGTCLLQWGLLLTVLFALRNTLRRRISTEHPAVGSR